MIAIQSSSSLTTFAATTSSLFLTFLWYMGVFKKIQFHQETIGPFKFIYRSNKGPYREVGPFFNSTLEYMNDTGFGHCKTAGIYYDDPATTPNPRYAVGFIIDDKKDDEQFDANKEDILKEWRLLEIKETKTIASYFPIRITVLSCMLSAMKTYSAFKRQDKYKNSTGCLEIYFKDRVGTYFIQSNLNQFSPPNM